MDSEWPVMTLREAGVALLDCEHKTPPAAIEGYPYIAIPNIQNGHLELTNARRITRAHYLEWTRKTEPRPGDVIVTRRGRVGDSALVPEGIECAIGQNLVILRSDESRVRQDYLRWLLRSPHYWEQVSKFLNVGAVFDSLNCRDIPRFELPIPPAPEQEAVAHTLDALDNKIELNKRMNQTLEAIAKALFSAWFVSFDDDADLVDSELGPIPRGWKIEALPDVIEVNPRRRLRKGCEAPFVEMKDLPTNEARIGSWRPREFTSGSRFLNGDVLLARITPCLENGKTAFVDFLQPDETGWGSTEFLVLRSKPPLPVEYAYFLARSPEFRQLAIANMTGSSGRQRVRTQALAHYKLPVPPPPLAERFGAFARVVFQSLKARDDESRTLAELRDLLLPKLISGEIRVPEAERLVEEAV